MITTDFSKYFNNYKKTSSEGPLPFPSLLIPKEINRWELYLKLVTNRTQKYLLNDKQQFVKYLKGETLPLSRVYESSQYRPINLNPSYDISSNTFPLWDDIARLVYLIGNTFDENSSIKSNLTLSLKKYINFLKSLNLRKLDDQIKKYDIKLKSERRTIIDTHVMNRTKLKKYPYIILID